MKLGISTLTALVGAAIVALGLAAVPNTASAQVYETDHEFESRIKAEIRSVRRRIEKFRKELTGEDVVEPGRRGTGLYPGAISRLKGLEERCDFQEQYVERMTPSSMRSPYEVERERQAVRDDIRNVQRELSRIKRDMDKLDEEVLEEERKRAEADALDADIMKEEW